MKRIDKFSTPNDKDTPFLTYKEAGEFIGITAASIIQFAVKNNIPRGNIVRNGIVRGVIDANRFYEVVDNKNYHGKHDKKTLTWKENK